MEVQRSERRVTARRALYGFTFEGIFRQHMIVKGQNRDTAWYSMLDSEWPERKARFEAWLADENFDAAGRQKRALGRGQLGLTAWNLTLPLPAGDGRARSVTPVNTRGQKPSIHVM